jgi:uncharacterized protein YeeX (DUF496 family)
VRELILECIEDFKLDFEEQIDDKILDAIDISKLNLFESQQFSELASQSKEMKLAQDLFK